MARAPAPVIAPGPAPAMGAPPAADMAPDEVEVEVEPEGPAWRTIGTLQTDGAGQFRLLEGDEPGEPEPMDDALEAETGGGLLDIEPEPAGMTVGFEERGELLNRMEELMAGDEGAEGGGPRQKAFKAGYEGEGPAKGAM